MSCREGRPRKADAESHPALATVRGATPHEVASKIRDTFGTDGGTFHFPVDSPAIPFDPAHPPAGADPVCQPRGCNPGGC